MGHGAAGTICYDAGTGDKKLDAGRGSPGSDVVQDASHFSVLFENGEHIVQHSERAIAIATAMSIAIAIAATAAVVVVVAMGMAMAMAMATAMVILFSARRNFEFESM